MKHLRIALLAVGLVLTVMVCKTASTRSNSADDPAAAGGKAMTHHEVAMRDYSFAPESLSVSVGDTVTWVNRGQAAHSTTSGVDGKPDGRWDSGQMDPRASYSHVFSETGNFHYYCTPHQAMGMKGVISVH